MTRWLTILGGLALAGLAALFLLGRATDADAGAAGALPAQVDLRPQFLAFGLPPSSQGPRNTCSVFATAGALEFAYSRSLGRGMPLSVEYLNWATNQVIGNKTRDRGQFFHHILQGFERHGAALDRDMPYRKHFDPDLKPAPGLVARARQVADAGLTVHWIHRGAPGEFGITERQLRDAKAVLARGWPVAAGSKHSRLLVGYVDDPAQPGGGYFITKDSGKASFRRLAYDTARTKLASLFWVEAPLEAGRGAS